MEYEDQLLKPQWQKKRLEILQRDNFTCQICLDTETTLHIHHIEYDPKREKLAWEYPDHIYKTLCSFCHKHLTAYKKVHGTEKGFDVLRIKKEGYIDSILVYENGVLKAFLNGDGEFLGFSPDSLKKLVHFTINNWLKNG